jgi:hypothetical protein
LSALPLWGSQFWLQPAFSRLCSPAHPPVSAARDVPAMRRSRWWERAWLLRRRVERQGYFMTSGNMTSPKEFR